MASAIDTRMHILLAAIEVLKELGMEGLTMRKVAAQADMSLGNLQYHYKNKTALIAGLAEYYFAECERMLDTYEHRPKGGAKRDQLKNLILFYLDHMDELTDMCRIFREMWALSTRDDHLHEQLMDYYKSSIRKLSRLLETLYEDQDLAHHVAEFLTTYMEGYSITIHALDQTKEEHALWLTEYCWRMDT